MLKKIAAALKKQTNYVVPGGFELVTQPTTGDVRYFHKEDEANATPSQRDCRERRSGPSGIEKTLELKPSLRLGAAKDIPQGWIEVWLPSLPAPSNIRRPLPNSDIKQGPKLQMPYSKK